MFRSVDLRIYFSGIHSLCTHNYQDLRNIMKEECLAIGHSDRGMNENVLLVISEHANCMITMNVLRMSYIVVYSPQLRFFVECFKN